MTEILIILLVITASAFFSGSEIGFVSANRLKLEIKARKDTLSGRYLNYFVRNPESFLSTTLIGNNIANVAYATLMALFLVSPITSYYLKVFGNPPSDVTVLLIQTVIASFLIMMLGEIMPKAIFRIHSDFLISLFAVPLKVFNWLFTPFIYISNRAASVLIGLFQKNTDYAERVFRRQDLEMLLQEIGDDETSDIDRDDSEILSNVLELSNKRVRETMIPRTDIVAINKNATLQEVMNTFVSSGVSRLPVFDENIDDIIGVVFAYDLFKKPKSLNEIIRPVKLIPSSQKSKDLLTEFQKLNISLAIVIDEYGGTAGLVTIEDLLEEVVGDIQDEYDIEATVMKKIAPDTYIISGNTHIEELTEKYPEIELERKSNGYETIAGYIISAVGRIPQVNEEIVLGPYKFIISKATLSRIESIKLTRIGDR
ncbi:MAG: hemolysin family protein [Balneolales bacterium]